MVSSFCRSYVAVDPGNVCGVAARNWVETQSGADTLLGLDGSFGETAGSIRVAERDWRAAAADEYASFQTATNHERVRDDGAAFCCDRGRRGISFDALDRASSGDCTGSSSWISGDRDLRCCVAERTAVPASALVAGVVGYSGDSAICFTNLVRDGCFSTSDRAHD